MVKPSKNDDEAVTSAAASGDALTLAMDAAVSPVLLVALLRSLLRHEGGELE